MKYIKSFENHTEYETFTGTTEFILPNVSLCKQENEVHYSPVIKVTGVILDKSELSLNKGETETLVATVLPSDASNKNVIWSSSNESIATVDDNGLVTAVGDSGNANITVTTVDGGHTAQCALNIINPCASEKVETTYDWIEIGGIKWATKNVGALTVTSYGQKFSWGGVNGYTNKQVSDDCHAFSWDDYEHCVTSSIMTKYNSDDGKVTLEAVDDAATVNMGAGWRMPTNDEFNALSAATTSRWVSSYEGSGVAGLVLTDKTDSSKVLFFPAAGMCANSRVNDASSQGYYWSSSLYTSRETLSKYFKFASYSPTWDSNGNRNCGFSVRGVYVG